MKKIFTILGVVGTAAIMSAQNLMPNPGFEAWTGTAPVSYTHLDVYKRQDLRKAGHFYYRFP